MEYYNLVEYLDPKWKYVVLKRATDDENDKAWTFKETEEEAIAAVKSETEEYGNVDQYQFYYEAVRR